MSGIFGLFNLDGAPADATDLSRMASLLNRRGPDRTGMWHAGPVGMGHTLLATTQESLLERLPVMHARSGCVITADVRLDNRAELLDALDLAGQASVAGDAGLVLAGYLAWGTACVERFLGDFAFAIWDPRQRRLFCARDHFGMRPFYYHHAAGRFFAFASEPRAILVLPQTPYRVNEGRIADFLVQELEGIDKTSTFFEDVYRLPPAHTITVGPQGVSQRRYWSLEPGPELRLKSDEAYAEAFLGVFTEAVRCRLRGAGPVGSMLSGGMDSGSVVAVGSRLLAEQGAGPLPTFSATAPDPTSCIETQTIQAALTMEGLNPSVTHYGQLDEFMPELEDLTWHLDEPFDNHMTLPRVLYLAARRSGVRVLLDGAAGDVVLGEGSHLARLVRQGKWLTAYRDAVARNRFWGGACPVWPALALSAGDAVVPYSVRRMRRRLLNGRRARRRIRECVLQPRFATRVSLADRLWALSEHGTARVRQDYRTERARSVEHPYLTVARERYDRVAAAVGVEPRDPFMDRRVVEFCLGLPGEQRAGGGWPKAILRRAMAGRLPDNVRWRPGKEHLGLAFTRALVARGQDRLLLEVEAGDDIISEYVDIAAVRRAYPPGVETGGQTYSDTSYAVAHLGNWLRQHTDRPRQVLSSGS